MARQTVLSSAKLVSLLLKLYDIYLWSTMWLVRLFSCLFSESTLLLHNHTCSFCTVFQTLSGLHVGSGNWKIWLNKNASWKKYSFNAWKSHVVWSDIQQSQTSWLACLHFAHPSLIIFVISPSSLLDFKWLLLILECITHCILLIFKSIWLKLFSKVLAHHLQLKKYIYLQVQMKVVFYLNLRKSNF